jgi:hypothetical protein
LPRSVSDSDRCLTYIKNREGANSKLQRPTG